MITITVDAKSALARFSPAGIPESVRSQLRVAIPDLMRDLAKEVDNNLSALKSRVNLQTKPVMIENGNSITGQLSVIWTGDSEKDFVPQILETGARPHVIEARNVKALAFQWNGGLVFFKKVNHPGFAGIRYMENAFESMKPQIEAELDEAVNRGLQE